MCLSSVRARRFPFASDPSCCSHYRWRGAAAGSEDCLKLGERSSMAPFAMPLANVANATFHHSSPRQEAGGILLLLLLLITILTDNFAIRVPRALITQAWTASLQAAGNSVAVSRRCAMPPPTPAAYDDRATSMRDAKTKSTPEVLTRR